MPDIKSKYSWKSWPRGLHSLLVRAAARKAGDSNSQVSLTFRNHPDLSIFLRILQYLNFTLPIFLLDPSHCLFINLYILRKDFNVIGTSFWVWNIVSISHKFKIHFYKKCKKILNYGNWMKCSEIFSLLTILYQKCLL